MRGAIMPYLLLTRFEIELNICSQIGYSKELQILELLRPSTNRIIVILCLYVSPISRYIKKRVMT